MHYISGGLESVGVSTFTGNVHVGAAITMHIQHQELLVQLHLEVMVLIY